MIRRILLCAVMLGIGGCVLFRSDERLTSGHQADDGGDGEADSGRDVTVGAPPSDADARVDASPDIPGPLIYYYRFDGDASDSSGNGNEGALREGARIDAPGVSGTALSCNAKQNGGNQRFEFGGSYVPGKSSFSVSLFFRLGSGANDGNTLIEHGCQFQNSSCGESGFGIGFYVTTGGASFIAFVLDEPPTSARYTAAGFDDAPVDTAFHHVAMVVDRVASGGGTLTFFYDGEQKARQPLRSDIGVIDPAGTAQLCKQADPSQSFTGTIDEVMLFGRALTASEVMTLATRFK